MDWTWFLLHALYKYLQIKLTWFSVGIEPAPLRAQFFHCQLNTSVILNSSSIIIYKKAFR